MAPARVIGIDLGTSNCCLSVYGADGLSILEIDGARTMPSCVAFTNETYLVGQTAFEQITADPANTIVGAKRLIGREWSDREVQNDIINMGWPFLVDQTEFGRPQYVVRCLGEVMKVLPEMVSRLLLTKMREAAEQHLGGPVDAAVITVPAYFSDAQRQATKTAAMQANLKIVNHGLINEPTAAALAYSRQFPSSSRRTALVFDLGGGTFDVSLVRIEEGIVDVVAVDGNNHLGGEDFTNAIVVHLLRRIQETEGVDLKDPNSYRTAQTQNQQQLNALACRAVLRLKQACEGFKCTLSTEYTATKQFDGLSPRLPRFTAALDRARFEEINKDLFQMCLDCTQKVLRDGKVEPGAVDDVIMVGGSTRMPKVKRMLVELFGPEKIRDNVNPDEVVAYGAGMHAAGLHGLAPALLIDVTNFSLGVETVGDVMSIICPRNHPVGSTKERTFTTSVDGQSTVTFNVHEGEESRASQNKRLESFSLHNVPPMRAGEPIIIVKFRIDYDGTLSAKAELRVADGNLVVKRALRVSRKRDETGIREREQMAAQGVVLGASRLGNGALPADRR